ncbi:MAG: GNAT family protein [Fermentimonas sp.]|jgi:ribosomal-protein-serine acetyltransferase|nr:GNAT family protein [Fermentimonas sp.]NLC85475.1 GNAT family N-acetyltransferase [Bacteroidales bacterium]HBT84823.1 N-acetyltransferase [Porphyromonadaceae bacterium]MDD2932029.1 GNAT family protein [Fermentimonas sp.]MDD3189263.1 GNAT family protein [Fermentimonas sp.]
MILRIDENIVLKQLELSDAKDIFITIDSQREYLGKWLPFVETTRGITDSEMYVSSVVNTDKDYFEYVFAIKYQDEFAGIVGFKDTDKANRKTEIGYWLSEGFQKKGIMTKSVDMICDFAFKTLNINRIQIKCAVGNTPSSNIPKRLNFKFEGIERDGELLSENHFVDLEIYSKLKSDY